MSELKPCPFCGEEPATRAGFAICINDDCEQSNYWSGLDIDAWNTRPIEDALNARIVELEMAQREALLMLPKLERGHTYCDDCWYSCPKSVDGCCDASQGEECNCGADKYNKLLAEIIGLLTPPEVKQ